MKLLAVCCVVLGLCACGGDDDGASATGGGGDGGSAGTGGTGGAAGSAGTGGTGGDAGSAGTGGTGGDAGSSGTGGTGGADACDDITCDDDATCDATGSGPVCMCNSGYVGDGTTCTDVDECDDGSDNCPDNATCVNTEGSFRCDCDMRGTYAGVLYTEASWAGVGQGLILDGSTVLPSFELRTITAQDNGELTITVLACGGTTADFCVDPQYVAPEPIPSVFPSIAYGQDFPKSLWGNLDPATATVPMPVVAIGEPFLTSDQAAFLGLSLEGDPLQEWPTNRNDPAITWLDPDDDTVPGVTSLARHVDRNGDPEYDDVGESAECASAFPPNVWDDPNTSEVETEPYPLDRIGFADVTWPYDYWITPSAGGEKVKAFHTGARTVSRFNGAITNCDTIEGELVVSEINARLHSCVTDSDTPCSDSIVDALDGAPDPNTIEGGCFQFVRVENNATCESVRAHVFDLLVNGRCPTPSL